MKKFITFASLFLLAGCSVGGVQLTKETAICERDGQKFALGETVKTDDCNSCVCSSTGELENCTKIACDLPGLANPSATKCIDDGFKYEIRRNADGSEFGVCIDAAGTECVAWEFFRAECVLGANEDVDEPTEEEEIVEDSSGEITDPEISTDEAPATETTDDSTEN